MKHSPKGQVIKSQEEHDGFFFKTPVLAFLDILGFSDLVRNNEHKIIVDLYNTLVNVPIDLYTSYQKRSSQNSPAELSALRIINVSDSIVLWTENSKHGSILDLIYSVQLFMQVSMEMGIPLRGAITKGDFHVFDRNDSISIVGKPLVCAAELEKKQQWSGCIVSRDIIEYSKSYEKVVNGRDTTIFERIPNVILPYNEIPLRNNEVMDGYVINWVTKKMSEESITKSFSAYKKGVEGDTIKNKIRNTLTFFNFCS